MKYFTIENERGHLLGYVKAEEEVDAYQKVLDHYPGICPDNRLICEINKRDVEKEYRKLLKEKDLVEC